MTSYPVLSSPTLESSPTQETGGAIPAGIWAYSLVVDGVSLALDTVLADLTVRHGRSSIFDGASASTFQASILDCPRAFVSAFRTGAPIVFNAATDSMAPFPRFTGFVTDGGLSDNDLTVVAVGPLSRLPNHMVGLVDYPQEAWSARIGRMFAEAGLSSQLALQRDTGFDPVIAARAATPADDPHDLLSMLTEVADTVGAAIADLPDGRTLVQAIGSRVYTGGFTLDPAIVEYAPDWTLVLPGANTVTVEWVGGKVSHTDELSAGYYGPRLETITTTLVNFADADTRALERLARLSMPHWEVHDCSLLDPVDLQIGRILNLHTLPDAAPFDPWNPVLEGWTDTIDGPDWTMVLNVSDPLASGLALPWNEVAPAELWQTVNPETSWAEALTDLAL